MRLSKRTREVGKLADLAVLSEDYLTIPLEKMASIHSKLTHGWRKICLPRNR
jgi:predicted amidohydrolase YtcJ